MLFSFADLILPVTMSENWGKGQKIRMRLEMRQIEGGKKGKVWIVKFCFLFFYVALFEMQMIIIIIIIIFLKGFWWLKTVSLSVFIELCSARFPSQPQSILQSDICVWLPAWCFPAQCMLGYSPTTTTTTSTTYMLPHTHKHTSAINRT